MKIAVSSCLKLNCFPLTILLGTMCIAYFAWQAKTLEDLLLLTLFNRDEQLDR